MRISQKKLNELYHALESNIMSMRIEVSRADKNKSPFSAKEIDDKLYILEQAIWMAQEKVLNPHK